MPYIGKAPASGIRSRFIYTATAAQTTFTGADGNGKTLGYTDGEYVDVYLNGVLLDPADYTATSKTSVVLDSGATVSDIVEIVVYDTFSVFNGTFTTGITAGDATITGDLTVDTNTLYVDSTNNRVGVGTASPAVPLHVKVGTNENFYMSSDSGVRMQAINDAASAINTMKIGGDPLIFLGTGGTERMRIDSSGNLLINKTTSNFGATAGSEFLAGSDNIQYLTSDAQTALIVNRLTSEGTMALFRKGGAERLKIGARSANGGAIGYSGTGLEFNAAFNLIAPINTDTYALRDNAIDLGAATARFDDVFATNGTIQTSDQNEKQQIASLTDAEITAAKAISKLFKTFKWKDKVTSKGDNARTHSGVIAQEVQTAMTDAGLDATKYAFFCSDTWWETQTEVPAVEAVDAVTETQTNEEGDEVQVVVKEAVEAQDAYTRTDTYDTAEEAPEGATERTRLGIRYPELLAFVGAATEQRLADIETRLTALEA